MASYDSKLDQALGKIIQLERENAPRRRNQQRRSTGASKAPAGGIQKTRAQPHRRVASQPARVSSWKSNKFSEADSKVLVSNLPYDVTEVMIKEYFDDTVGDVTEVEIHYGPDGRSRGKADITFAKESGASIALEKLDGLRIDGRPIQVEIIGVKPDPRKPIAERAAQPKREKVQPKSAADIKEKGQQTKRTGGTKKNQPRRGARNARPAKKTAEELDKEMTDYFESIGNENADGEDVAPPAVSGGDDAAMDDDIS